MTRLNRIRLLLIVTMIAAAAIRGDAQGEITKQSTLPGGARGGSIRGRVVLPSGQSLSSPVQLRLSNFVNPGMTGYTDTSGRFSFERVAPGNYVLEVIPDPKLYERTTEQVTITPESGGQIINLTIELRERVSSAASAESEQAVPPAARKEYEKAAKLIKDGNDQKAVEHLKQAITLYPDYLMARNTLGAEYLKLKQTDEAIQQLTAAIRIDPTGFNPRLHMGIALVEQKKYAEAVDHLSKAVAVDSTQPDARLYLGIAQLGSGTLEAAERELTAALAGGPKYLIAHYYKAHVYIRQGDKQRAMAELRSYLEKAPKGEQVPHAQALLEKLKAGS